MDYGNTDSKSAKSVFYQSFWQVFIHRGAKDATIFLNQKNTNGIIVPTFLKFRRHYSESAFVCINIQELLKPRHIESLSKGWPEGRDDPNVSNIWYRLQIEASKTVNDLPISKISALKIKFTPVTWQDAGIEKKSGYIVFDYATDSW